MSDVYNRDPENDLTYDSGTGSYVLTSSLLDPDPIDESTTVKELAVNSTVYDIVGKGILDQNSKTTQIEWVGTKAEYDALGVYADYCTYIITDDSADSRVDEVGAIAEEVNTLKSYDYVVDWQIPTSANDYMWYRKYKSGWVEQGGIAKIQATTNRWEGITVAFPKQMANNMYTAIGTAYGLDSVSTLLVCIGGINSNNEDNGTGKTTTHMFIQTEALYDNTVSRVRWINWQVSGMAA